VTTETTRPLEVQREEVKNRRLIATPLAGTIVWTALGVAGAVLPTPWAVLAFYIGTGCIFYLGLLISRFTGEYFFDKSRPKNTFDTLFLLGNLMALLVFAVAIPFQLQDPTSLPLSLGILTGLMWVPVSWIIGHWVGLFHTFSRTALVLAAWYLAPDQRFTVIPAVIVAVYLASLVILNRRWRALPQQTEAAA